LESILLKAIQLNINDSEVLDPEAAIETFQKSLSGALLVPYDEIILNFVNDPTGCEIENPRILPNFLARLCPGGVDLPSFAEGLRNIYADARSAAIDEGRYVPRNVKLLPGQYPEVDGPRALYEKAFDTFQTLLADHGCELKPEMRGDNTLDSIFKHTREIADNFTHPYFMEARSERGTPSPESR
jgi:hypothetical protein